MGRPTLPRGSHDGRSRRAARRRSPMGGAGAHRRSRTRPRPGSRPDPDRHGRPARARRDASGPDSARPSLRLVRLDSLDETDSGTLLDHLAPELSAGRLRSRIVDAAEGNPLFVEQLVAYASDDARSDGQTLDDGTAVDLAIPPTIGTLLAARLDRLPDDERRLLERAAVVGRTFWAGAVADLLAEQERAELPRRLAHLARRDLIRAERSDVLGRRGVPLPAPLDPRRGLRFLAEERTSRAP